MSGAAQQDDEVLIMTESRQLRVPGDLGHSQPWREVPLAANSVRDDRRPYLLAKRLLDIVIASTALVVLSPLLLLIALLIKLHSEGPALFVQERVGWDERTRTGRIFRLYKFRSMRANSDPRLHREHMASLIKNNSAPAPECGSVKMANDLRITGLGRILRKSSLDELPQLINVLKGDMSLVGPRPALPYEVELYQEWHRRRLEALPGLTGWWQVKGRCRVAFDEAVRLDIYYVDHRSLALDLKILFLTPWAVISGRGAG
jgi:lipopolysaccharide/colanic/teichoic acid biosynthesis glycosyltransferase